MTLLFSSSVALDCASGCEADQNSNTSIAGAIRKTYLTQFTGLPLAADEQVMRIIPIPADCPCLPAGVRLFGAHGFNATI